jgi:hypothetical protein
MSNNIQIVIVIYFKFQQISKYWLHGKIPSAKLPYPTNVWQSRVGSKHLVFFHVTKIFLKIKKKCQIE